MKETGIIMSGNHPKLIQDGIKTMTRRTWGLEEVNKNPDLWAVTPNIIGCGGLPIPPTKFSALLKILTDGLDFSRGSLYNSGA